MLAALPMHGDNFVWTCIQCHEGLCQDRVSNFTV